MSYGRCGNIDVGDTVHRVGEMVQQVGEAVQPSWRQRFIKLRPQQLRFFPGNKKTKNNSCGNIP